MKFLSVLGLHCIVISLVLCDKWNFMKEEDRKKFEKKKDFRNVGENKKDSYVKPISKFAIKKSSKMEELFTPEVFMKDEKNQLCQSVGEDDVKNTLLKFGKVLHLFHDISIFKKNLKTLSGTSKKSKEKVKPVKENKSNSKADKEMIKQKGGPNVKLTQSNFVGRSLQLLSPMKIFFNEEGNNFLEEQQDRKKRDTYKYSKGRKGTLKVPLGQVPQCYGWKYLSSLDAMIDDKTVDVDFLSESMSDMLDMSFSSVVSTIFDECNNAMMTSNDPMCPVVDVQDKDFNMDKCSDSCNPEHTGGYSDCSKGYICCKSQCGGYQCLKSSEGSKNKPEKCKVADQFMQCVYQKIDTQICS